MFLKELKNNKKYLPKIINQYIIQMVKGFNLCIESNPTGAYEPCQVRKEAAISRYFLWECSL